ncbi:putative motility protein [Alkalicoccus chagannorensis]|uniref:putative motility protein n=1 Tax=Alkalicoccus chagannorensis TaxID=427072 RepID=UPI0003F67CF6|nr:putative motility protein [Alkalicoccus chagannorensis]
MDISSMMQAQTAQLQQTVSMSLLKSSLSTDAAQSINMLEKMNEGSASTSAEAPHPTSGSSIDIRL